MSAAAGEATNLLKHGYAASVKGTQDYSAKVLEFTNANINAAVEQATKLASVKWPMEFFALSNDYAKRQFEILTRQALPTGSAAVGSTHSSLRTILNCKYRSAWPSRAGLFNALY